MTGALRVVHVVQPVDGGAARVVAQLAEHQQAAGWDVLVACPDGGVLAGELEHLGVRRRRWDARRGPAAGTPGQVQALARLLTAAAPDVVHLHSASAGMTGRLALRGQVPTVFQPHGWSWQAVTGAVARATTAWERLAQRWSSLVVCVSDDERDSGLRAGVRRGLVVVPNGVDLVRFPATDASGRDGARRRLGWPDAPTVVCVARLTPQKGQDALVRAWPAVRDRVPDARLVLVGDGETEQDLRALVAGLGLDGAVLLAGARGDVADCYAAADVVAFSSLHGEAMALTPLEAQASGRSLVATDVAGVRASLGPGAGEVVPPGDVPALADALAARLLDPDRAAAEGRAGREHAERALSVERTAERVMALTAGLVPGDV